MQNRMTFTASQGVPAPAGDPTPEIDETTGENPLFYVTDYSTGIRRRRAGKGFAYIGLDGKPLRGPERLRVQKLGIPPAYENVWICPDPNGHIQATGYDSRGRKQYRYHPLWSSSQSETKYADLLPFGRVLPAIRRGVNRDLQGTAGDRQFSLAALILLLDRAYLRVGNEAYTAQNRSFGATTLLRRHLSFRDGAVRLAFRAKGGKPVRQILRDKRLHRILQNIHDLPGRNLFTYLDDSGKSCSIGSMEVNAYLAEISGMRVTAKTFRTWGGTLAAFEHARAMPVDGTLTLKSLAQAAADRLHNTPTIARKSYIHPAVLQLATLSASQRAEVFAALVPAKASELRITEAELLAFLEQAANPAE